MGRAIAFGILVATAACGEDEKGADCAQVAGKAREACGDTFDEATCVDQCEMQGHPVEHLDAAAQCIDEAADCDAALECLDVDFICNA